MSPFLACKSYAGGRAIGRGNGVTGLRWGAVGTLCGATRIIRGLGPFAGVVVTRRGTTGAGAMRIKPST